MKTDLFQSCGHCWVFQNCWHIECSTFTASSFRIWNSSAGIPSPPLVLFNFQHMCQIVYFHNGVGASPLPPWYSTSSFIKARSVFYTVYTASSFCHVCSFFAVGLWVFALWKKNPNRNSLFCLHMFLTYFLSIFSVFSSFRRHISIHYSLLKSFSGGSAVNNPPGHAGEAGSISGWGRSPREGNGYPFQYSCLGDIMDRGAWWAKVHGVTKDSDTT